MQAINQIAPHYCIVPLLLSDSLRCQVRADALDSKSDNDLPDF